MSKYLILTALVFLLGTGSILQGCQNCTYFNRLLEPTCRPLTGSVLKTKITRSAVTPPSDISSSDLHKLVKFSISCPNSVPLCDHYSNLAGIFAILVPNSSGSGTFISPSSGITYSSCSNLWVNLSTILASEITAIFIGASNAPGFSVSCDDSVGCNASSTSSIFINYNPNVPTLTDYTVVPVSAGNYLTCSYFDSYALTNSIPPLGLLNIIDISNAGLPVPNTLGEQLGFDFTSWVGVPISPDVASSGFLSITVGSDTVISFNTWSNAP